MNYVKFLLKSALPLPAAGELHESTMEMNMKKTGRFFVIALLGLLPASGVANTSAADDAKSFLSSGEVKFGKGDNQGAMADYTKAIELDPKLSEAYNSRAALKYSAGDKPGAITDYTKAIELNSQFTDAYNNRGNAKAGMGDVQGAIADYTRAIELDPAFVPAYMNRAAIKLDLGDKPGVIADLSSAAKLGHPAAQQWLHQNGVAGW
ncbi:MAG: tetratricopeptide repeat protein [Chlorobium sp.]|nr:MAG: tetratricopeptide repeat protein [Chlorobium sp.]